MGKQTKHSLTTVQTKREALLFQDYILTVFTVDFQLGTLFFVRSLRLVFIHHFKRKKKFEADLSCDRSYRLSYALDRHANVRAMASTGMLSNFNI